jgi:hypothetical protein
LTIESAPAALFEGRGKIEQLAFGYPVKGDDLPHVPAHPAERPIEATTTGPVAYVRRHSPRLGRHVASSVAVGSQVRESSLRGRQLLDRVAVLRSACDLDLLLFFARHPRSLLTSDEVARFLGYDLKELAASLEVLTAAGIVTRIQNPTQPAQLFVFMPGRIDGGALPMLLKFASTREGRVELLRSLAPDPGEGLALLHSRRRVVGG